VLTRALIHLNLDKQQTKTDKLRPFKRPKRSPLFKESFKEDENEPGKLICLHCEKGDTKRVVACGKGSTSNAWYHLQKCHPIIYAKLKSSDTPEITNYTPFALEVMKEGHMMVVKFIIHGLHAFTVVDSKGFVDLMRWMNPRYHVLTPNMYKHYTFQLYDQTRAKVYTFEHFIFSLHSLAHNFS
jgi:hypothetical protein